jgi:hypothetical protein
MLLRTDSLEFWLLCAVSAGFLASLAYVVMLKQRARREEHNIAAVKLLIIEYFRKTGVEVAVDCTRLPGNQRFTALIESEPMKRFRLSHIIEMTLRDHIQKSCGLDLEKIYWRFPIKEVTRDASSAAPSTGTKPAVGSDEYINEGLVHYKDLPKMEVTEISWDKFEEVVTIDSEKKPPSGS